MDTEAEVYDSIFCSSISFFSCHTSEAHGFRNEENEIEFYRAAERFLGEHLTDSMR
jgi:hypothetical protein